MVSKERFIISGTNVDIYGLKEYREKQKKSSKRVPLAVMFALHGFVYNMDLMEPLCEVFCSEDRPRQNRRHLIMVSFDLDNHGTRYVGLSTVNHPLPVIPKSHFQYVDMWDFCALISMAGATISKLIDSLEYHMFGPESISFVEAWGAVGFSVGGSAAIIAAAKDPRLSVVISIAGPPRVYNWAQHLLNLTPEKEIQFLSQRWIDKASQLQHNVEEQLCDTKLYIITGEKDSISPPKLLVKFGETMRSTHRGREGLEWAIQSAPGERHDLSLALINTASRWSNQWLLLEEEEDLPRAKL